MGRGGFYEGPDQVARSRNEGQAGSGGGRHGGGSQRGGGGAEEGECEEGEHGSPRGACHPTMRSGGVTERVTETLGCISKSFFCVLEGFWDFQIPASWWYRGDPFIQPLLFRSTKLAKRFDPTFGNLQFDNLRFWQLMVLYQ